ncbi:MAG: iron-containing alcohol dehydrogenase [Candidatus Omnitrophica bacterium]|jgi:3-dehydroquinate synthase|nr:iron-containing alcohol dehydrogenase [Candidatus Omnitrophota bacterium]
MSIIRISSRIHNYQVTFGNFSSLYKTIEKKYSPGCYLIDKNVWSLYKNRYFSGLDQSKVIFIKADEFNKSLKTVQNLYDKLIERAAKRNTVLVAIGGGITQDVAGFFASTLYRGIKWVFVPTTLLAQADSCIGSKTSLNYKNFKNLIGTFYPPHAIFIDRDFNCTLRAADFYSGLGEIVKLHIMGGQGYFKTALMTLPRVIAGEKKYLDRLISNSLLIKKGYIEEDEFDWGRRNLLNYGHCFGHAVESASDFKIPHGQAVVFGIMLANIVSRKRGLLFRGLENKIFDKLLLPIVTSDVRPYLSRKGKIISSMEKDKKRIGAKFPLIVVKNRFRMAKLMDLEKKEINFALDDLMSKLKNYEIS